MTMTRTAFPFAIGLIAAGLAAAAPAAPATGHGPLPQAEPSGIQVAQIGVTRPGPGVGQQQPGWLNRGGRGMGPGRGMGQGQGMGPGAAAMMANVDANGDGKVQGAEFMAWHDGVFDAMDADGNGALDKDEYMAVQMGPGAGQAMQGPMREQMQAAKAAAFDAADTDGDGVLNRTQFTDMAADAFTGADADGDGALTAGEFGGMHMMR